MSDSVLDFEAASYRPDPDHDCALADVDLRLAPGDLVLVRLGARALRLPLADAAQGLLLSDAGRVLFEGRTWRERTHDERIAARHRIGRVHEGMEWVSNLDVDENVILAECHHTGRPEDEIVAEALGLAARFGLDELPDRRRPLVARLDLRVFALVRALLGAPRLLLLERPLRDSPESFFDPLAACLAEARAGGAAVLWTTDSTRVFEDPRWEPTLRLRVEAPRLVPVP